VITTGAFEWRGCAAHWSFVRDIDQPPQAGHDAIPTGPIFMIR
jgi:hypothetical protein